MSDGYKTYATTDEVASVEEKINNLLPLTLTGAVEATYNGREAVSVEIPEYIKTVDVTGSSISISDYETGLYRFVTTLANGFLAVLGKNAVAGENKGSMLFHTQSMSPELIIQITKTHGYTYGDSGPEATDTVIWTAYILGSHIICKTEYDPATDTYTSTKEYNGSNSLTISIPNVEGDIYYTGQRKEAYTLPRIPTPVAKTDEMTRPVGMDDSGLLYVAPQDFLPSVTTDDAGKFLRVSADGTWGVEAIPNAEEAVF